MSFCSSFSAPTYISAAERIIQWILYVPREFRARTIFLFIPTTLSENGRVEAPQSRRGGVFVTTCPVRPGRGIPSRPLRGCCPPEGVKKFVAEGKGRLSHSVPPFPKGDTLNERQFNFFTPSPFEGGISSDYFAENLYMVVVVYFWPGFKAVDGKSGLLGESGKC